MLKFTTFSYTKENGETVTRVGHIKIVIIHYDETALETIYEMYPSLAAQAKGAVPELHTQKVTIDLSNPEELGLLLSGSDLIWAKNRAAPFIADFTDMDENGKMVRVMKSLDDLGATIENVELPQ